MPLLYVNLLMQENLLQFFFGMNVGIDKNPSEERKRHHLLGKMVNVLRAYSFRNAFMFNTKDGDELPNKAHQEKCRSRHHDKKEDILPMKREKMIFRRSICCLQCYGWLSDKNFCSIVFSQERKDISSYFDGKKRVDQRKNNRCKKVKPFQPQKSVFSQQSYVHEVKHR